MSNQNPFSLAKASDYSDEEINELWTEIGTNFLDTVIEPTLKKSKLILGGKGSGKTHILRHYSYTATKLRHKNETGLEVIKKHQSIGVFLRANALEANGFLFPEDDKTRWQQLFGIFLELKLAEDLINILIDIKVSSPNIFFDDRAFIVYMANEVADERSFLELNDLYDVKKWIHRNIKLINDAINNFAFSNELHITPQFRLGSFSIKVKNAIDLWNSTFKDIPLIYFIDEIENFFSENQQQVVNSLIRYTSGLVSFRISGRLHAFKTYATIGNGEENREDVEFKKTYLDELLQENRSNYKNFAYSFIKKRLIHEKIISNANDFDISSCFKTINSNNFYKNFVDFLNINEHQEDTKFIKKFRETLRCVPNIFHIEDIDLIISNLTDDFPVLIKKHNILRFCKDFHNDFDHLETAKKIRNSATAYILDCKNSSVKSYKESYSHYAKDLVAQLNKDSKKPMIYAGFDTFIEMSSGNPRNLLTILSSAYDIARFKKLDFIHNEPLSIEDQSRATVNAARFIFEQDSNFGRPSDLARIAVKNLAELLRAARFSLNIPEVSPLIISFSDNDLTTSAKIVLQSALNYSFVFEIKNGRPNRNNLKISRKIALNPMLSPLWELPTGKRGDLGLPAEVANAIFDVDQSKEFSTLLKSYSIRWDQPFTKNEFHLMQSDLFT